MSCPVNLAYSHKQLIEWVDFIDITVTVPHDTGISLSKKKKNWTKQERVIDETIHKKILLNGLTNTNTDLEVLQKNDTKKPCEWLTMQIVNRAI